MKIDKNILSLTPVVVAFVTLGTETIKVKQYLPASDKIKLIEAIIDECLNVPLIDQVKFDALFNAFIILNYTDIEIDDNIRDIENLMQIYDYFESVGYMDLIIGAIPKIEYESLVVYLNATIEDYNKLKVSAIGVIESLVPKLPTLMEEVNKVLKGFDWSSLRFIKDVLTQLAH